MKRQKSTNSGSRTLWVLTLFLFAALQTVNASSPGSTERCHRICVKYAACKVTSKPVAASVVYPGLIEQPIKKLAVYAVNSSMVESSNKVTMLEGFQYGKAAFPLNFLNEFTIPFGTMDVVRFNSLANACHTDSLLFTGHTDSFAGYDATSLKIMRILQSKAHDKNLPFKNPDAQQIQPELPEVQYHALRITIMVFLWQEFSTLINY